MHHLTGWTALRAGAIWWLILAGLPLTWIVLRCLVEVRESRLAASLLVTAVGWYVGAAATALGAVSFAEPQIETTLAGAALLIGHWITFTAIASYARFVVLDAQGLIAAQPRIVGNRKTQKPSQRAKENSSETAAPAASPTISAAEFIRRKQQQAQSPKAAASGAWVDGSQPERDPYDDGDDDESTDDRKLSKADRKRLRKLKMQNRAA
jgi:hypothetical protein